jgi:hypothetical protein
MFIDRLIALVRSTEAIKTVRTLFPSLDVHRPIDRFCTQHSSDQKGGNIDGEK